VLAEPLMQLAVAARPGNPGAAMVRQVGEQN